MRVAAAQQIADLRRGKKLKQRSHAVSVRSSARGDRWMRRLTSPARPRERLKMERLKMERLKIRCPGSSRAANIHGYFPFSRLASKCVFRYFRASSTAVSPSFVTASALAPDFNSRSIAAESPKSIEAA